MKKKTAIILIVIGISTGMAGQGTDPFIREVGLHNPEIAHYEAILKERAVGSKTGNTPGALALGYGRYPGSPSSIGLKQTLEVSQSFDFPSTYIIRSRLNRDYYQLAGLEFQAGRLGVLLEARLLAYDYLRQTKRADIFAAKLADYDSLGKAWQSLTAEGAVTSIDYGRLTAELARARSAAAAEQARVTSLRIMLDYMSGGHADLLDGATYDQADLPEVADLAEIRRRVHPEFLIKEKEYAVSVAETGFSRAENLPGIEIGIGSEIVAGEHYTGPRIGLSVPLWTNRNKVRLSAARSEAAGAGRDAALAKLNAATEAEYEYLQQVGRNLASLKEQVGKGMVELAMKALEEREITITEYFAFIEASYELELALADLECEYFRSLARLTDHLLAGY